MQQNDLDLIAEDHPHVDPTALERSRWVERQLAGAGIKLGGYRLTPALGGTVPKYIDQRPRNNPEEAIHADRSIDPAHPPLGNS